MDTTKLKVGQDVYMVSGPYRTTGIVLKVTRSGVEVLASLDVAYTSRGKIIHKTREVWRFDSKGKACDSRGTGMFEPGPWENGGIPGTLECGAWILDDMPFAERKAELEEDRRIASNLEEECATPEGLQRHKERVLAMLNAGQGFHPIRASGPTIHEIAAAYAFGLKLVLPNETHNAEAADGTLVQIDLPISCTPDRIKLMSDYSAHLIETTVERGIGFTTLYNGSGRPVWKNPIIQTWCCQSQSHLQRRVENERRVQYREVEPVLRQLNATATRKLPQLHAFPKLPGFTD
jgi:hypothetical protein